MTLTSEADLDRDKLYSNICLKGDLFLIFIMRTDSWPSAAREH